MGSYENSGKMFTLFDVNNYSSNITTTVFWKELSGKILKGDFAGPV